MATKRLEDQIRFILEIDKEKKYFAPNAYQRLCAPRKRRGARLAYGDDGISFKRVRK